MAGRPPKPDYLKLVTGTARKSRQNPDAPVAPVGNPTMPAHLDAALRATWRRFAGVLSGMGVLTPSDGPALERMCGCYADILAARASYEADVTISRRDPMTGATVDIVVARGGEPTYVSQGKDGVMIRARPELALIADADRRLLSYLSQFGLTPAARGKVSTAPGSKAKRDPADAYFPG